MEEDVLIRVEGLSKKFSRDLRTSLRYGLADLTGEVMGKPRGKVLRDKEFWAVHDVSFEVKRGEVLGLLGHNGAGKTTLLRILNGLIKPDHGRVELRGRVGALIALGAGFNPILTGRENVYINAAVLGMGKDEVDSRIDEIIEFSEIGEFIDSPVRNYSSGMNVRLGFSVAAKLIKPDVLFLDEVLAVGDIGFTIKCLNTVRSLASDAAVVLVSHSMAHVAAFCSRTIVMDHGQVLLDSPNPADGIERYFQLSKHGEIIAGIGGISMERFVAFVNGVELSKDQARIEQGSQVEVEVEFTVEPTVTSGAKLGLVLNDAALTRLMTVPVMEGKSDRVFMPGIHRIRVSMGVFDLNAGSYSFLVAIGDIGSKHIRYRHQGLVPFSITAPRFHSGRIVRPTEAREIT